MYLHTWFLHFVIPMWPPRSPCGENQVLRYSTVRYGTCGMRHYIMSAAFCYLSTLQVPYLPLDVQVMSFTSLQVWRYRSTTLPSLPPETSLVSIVPPTTSSSLSFSYMIQSAPYNIPKVTR